MCTYTHPTCTHGDRYKDTGMNTDTQTRCDKSLMERRGTLLVNVLSAFKGQQSDQNACMLLRKLKSCWVTEKKSCQILLVTCIKPQHGSRSVSWRMMCQYNTLPQRCLWGKGRVCLVWASDNQSLVQASRCLWFVFFLHFWIHRSSIKFYLTKREDLHAHEENT